MNIIWSVLLGEITQNILDSRNWYLRKGYVDITVTGSSENIEIDKLIHAVMVPAWKFRTYLKTRVVLVVMSKH